jgi:hypothetical protein
VRLHLVGDLGSVEGLLIERPRLPGGHYKMIDATYLESHADRHALNNFATFVPREKVCIYEELKNQ